MRHSGDYREWLTCNVCPSWRPARARNISNSSVGRIACASAAFILHTYQRGGNRLGERQRRCTAVLITVFLRNFHWVTSHSYPFPSPLSPLLPTSPFPPSLTLSFSNPFPKFPPLLFSFPPRSGTPKSS